MRSATDPNTKENAMNRFFITLTLTGTLCLRFPNNQLSIVKR